MTKFIGQRPGWEDHASGTIKIEIDLELWASSGRDKHTDIDGQGAFLADAIANQLNQNKAFEVGDDVAIHELRYYGATEPSENQIATHEIRRRPAN